MKQIVILGVQKVVLSRKIFYVRNFHANTKGRRRNSEDVDEKTYGLCLYKSKGQNLLTNQRVIDSIVQKSDIRPTDTVLEIGPGTGNLTLKLLDAANNVVAVEIDSRMVDILRQRASETGLLDRLTIVSDDILKTDLPDFDIVVANIPYNISSPILEKLMYGPNLFRSATLLVQKEFGARLVAQPGDPEYNRLAANMSLVADIERVFDVHRSDFVPRPKVDSSVMILRPRQASFLQGVDLNQWLGLTRTCFGTKNKTLAAIFKAKRKVAELMGMSGLRDSRGEFRERIVRVLRYGGFEEKRPCKMSNDEFLCLLGLFNQDGISFNDSSSNGNARGYE